MVTDISDKALDELVARHKANSLSFHYHDREFHRETAVAITALRAQVMELKRDRDHWKANHDQQVRRKHVAREEVAKAALKETDQ